MKLTIEPTNQFRRLGGFWVRVWRGVDEAGAPVLAFVRAVCSEDRLAQDRLDAALHEIRGDPDSTLRMLDQALNEGGGSYKP